MKKFKKITSILSAIFLIALLVFVISMKLYPEQTSRIVGYRFYTVLTNSMEPEIPTYSLVLSKVIDEDEPIEPNNIVTFKANRFGEDILLTHYFRETQVGDDGNLYYRTQGATAPQYDNYETKRSDIIGTYVFHIPYLGKIFLFLQSKFGFVLYGELFVIYLINKLILTRMEEKEQEKKEKEKGKLEDHIENNENNKQLNKVTDKNNTSINLMPSSYIAKRLKAVYGQTLNDIDISSEGLMWLEGTQKVKAGLHIYKAIYIPRHTKISGEQSIVNMLIDTEKAIPEIDIPKCIYAKENEILSNIDLPEHFSWRQSDERVKAGEYRYAAIYTPEDIENYKTIELGIVIISKA